MVTESVYAEQYFNPVLDFWDWLRQSWEEFVIRYSGGIMTVSDVTFNVLCGIFCDWMRQNIHEYLERNIEQMKKRQQRRS
jgi:hypothetical protein